ncbi:MAG: diguanylate cyclase [Planctomycetota bacterium]
MPDHRASQHDRPIRLGGDAFDARVVLVGRTGQDATLRLDPSVELIRVRTGFDAVGELANPVGDVPGRTVVIVGSGSDIHKRNGGDDAFVSAARMVAPDAVVLRTSESGANSAECGAYDGVVPPSASADEVRELVHGRPRPEPESVPKAGDETDAAPNDQPEPVPEVVVKPNVNGLVGLAPDEDASDDTDAPFVVSMPGVTPPPASTNGTLIHDDDSSVDEPPTTPERVAEPKPPVSSTHEGLDEEELSLLREPEPTQSPLDTDGIGAEPVASMSSADDAASTNEAARYGGDGDDVLVAAALGGRDILEPAMGLIRARIGRSDVEFAPASDGAEAGAADGVEVAWSGRRYGRLRVGGMESGLIGAAGDAPSDDIAGRLAHQARWLGTWLALAEQHRRLRLEAYTDSVSGAWNRRYFDRFLEAALPHARQRRHKLTVLVFDLDNFKSFNDRFGHHAGDMILSETVRLLRSMTRPTDRICRIGGDEFAVVFYEPDGPRDLHSDHPHQFEMVSERFQRAVQEQRFPKLGIEAPGELSISGGLATFPWDGQTPAELLRRADELALASKAAGKNQITLGQRGDSTE